MKKRSAGSDKKNSVLHMLMTTRKGTTFFSIIAIVLVFFNIVVTSFSWFEPASQKGTGIKYENEINFRSENCTMKQYTGTNTNGMVSFSASEIPSGSLSRSLAGGDNGAVYYFKTEITNNDMVYPTSVSLFFSTFPSVLPSSTSIEFGVIEPSNTYRTYSTQQTDFYIVRNAYIAKNTGHNKDASLSVKWFIKVPKNKTITVNLADMYLTYN